MFKILTKDKTQRFIELLKTITNIPTFKKGISSYLGRNYQNRSF